MTDDLIIFTDEVEPFTKACKSVGVIIHNITPYTDKNLLKAHISFNYSYQMFFVGGQIERLKQLKKLQNETL